MSRQRLPNRRAALTEDISVGGHVYSATIGFDQRGQPKEIFLSGAQAASDMGAILADTSVVVSIALQCGVAAEAMAHSVSRVPHQVDGPPVHPASVIGAALDLLARVESETAVP